jgi:hypothetical protein
MMGNVAGKIEQGDGTGWGHCDGYFLESALFDCKERVLEDAMALDKALCHGNAG